MNGYLVILIVILSFSICNLVLDAEQSAIIRSAHEHESNNLLSKLRSVKQTAISMGLVCILAFSWTWWIDRNGTPDDSVAIAAFVDSSDGIGSIEGGKDEGYCYGSGGGRENSSPCVLIVSYPRVVERPDEGTDNWCFEVTYLVETNKIDTGIPWVERTLEAEKQYVVVCGTLTSGRVAVTYSSKELVQEKIKAKHRF